MVTQPGKPSSWTLVHVTTVPMTLFFLRGQVRYMRSRGFEVHAIASAGPELEAFAAEEDIPVHMVEMPRRISPFRDLVAVFELYRLLRHLAPVIVHGHTAKGGLLAMVAAWLAGVSVRIYTVHGLPLETASGFRRALLVQAEKMSCRLAHRVLCVSDSLRQSFLRERLCPENRIEVIGAGSINGVDAMSRFNPEKVSGDAREAVRARNGVAAEDRVVGYVGRIVRDKGLEILAEAWRELKVRHEDLHLFLVGPLEEQDPISPETLRLLEKDDRVHFLGLDWNTPPLYAAMDLVVLPSFREGFPVVPLEAAAMSLPVVATRVTGCADAVDDGVTGTLVAPRDAKALVAAISRYLGNEDLRKLHGAAGRKRVLEQFVPRAIWEGVYERYQEELSRSGCAAPRDVSGAGSPVLPGVGDSSAIRDIPV